MWNLVAELVKIRITSRLTARLRLMQILPIDREVARGLGDRL